MFSAAVIPQILIKYLLHASHYIFKYLLHATHDSLGHVGAMKSFHFLKRLYYFQGMRNKIHQYVRSWHKCQIMNLQKPYFMNLHQGIAQTTQDDISIGLLGPYTATS